MRRVVEAVVPARLGHSFRWLLASSWTNDLGDGIALAAGPLLVASQTDSPLLVSMAMLVQRLPWLLFGLYAGVLADRLDRRLLIVVVNLVRAAVLGVLGATIASDTVNIAMVLGVLFVLGTAEMGHDVPDRPSGAVPTGFQGRVGSVYLMCRMGGIVVGAALGGLPADVWGLTAPFVFAFVGSAIILVLIWPQLGHIAHADATIEESAPAPVAD